MSGNKTEVTAIITVRADGTREVVELKNSINSTGESVDKLAKRVNAFDAELNRSIATIGKGKAGLLEYKAEQLGLSEAYAPQLKKLKELEEAAKHGAHSLDNFSLSNAGAVRELMVMGRELGRGDMNRFVGSMTIFAQRAGLMSLVLNPAVLALAGLTAGVGVFTVAAIEGAKESHELANSLVLTGNYAGVTEGQINALADAIGQHVPGMAGHAREALQAMVSTGQISRDNLELFGDDILRISQLSGEKSDEIVKDFAKMGDGVAKWAEEHNRQYHFLTLAEYDYIDALEKSGDKQGAMKAVADDLKKSLDGQNESVGDLVKGYRWLNDTLAEVWEKMKRVGAVATPEERLAQLKADLAAGNSGPNRNSATMLNSDGDLVNKADVEREIADLQRTISRATAAADRKSKKDAIDQAGIAAQDAVTHLREETDARVRLNHELDTYRKNVAAIRAAGGTVTKAQEASDEAAIRHKYDHASEAAARKVASAYDNRLKSLNDEGVALQREVDNLKTYGQNVDKAREAVVRWNLEHDKTLKGLSDKQKAALIAAAQHDDELAQQKAAITTADSIEKKILSLKAEADAQAKVKGATQDAVLIQEIQANAAVMGAAKVKELTDAVHALAKEQAQSALNTALTASDAAYENEIARIKAETDALGLSNREKQHAVVLAQQLALANREIAAGHLTGSDAEAMRQRARDHADAINSATDALNAQSRSGMTGMSDAFNQFLDKTRDHASQVKGLWSDAFKGSEDAVVQFAKTGKLSVTGLADSIITDLIRMEVEDEIMAPVIASLRALMGLPPLPVPTAPSGGMSAAYTAAMFANGGIMTGAGAVSLPVNAYANGGIATSPQVAIYGEGKLPEAYVPLPDGRTIPVTMKSHGGGGGGHVFNTNVVVNGDGSSAVNGQASGQAFARVIQAAIRQEFINQRRDGGLLSSTPTGA